MNFLDNPPLAALFDMDGVLVNNARFHQQAWFAFAGQAGRPLTVEEYGQHINGRVAADSLPFVLGRAIQPDEVSLHAEAIDGHYRELYCPYLTATPGLIPFLETLKSRQIPMAVGTSAPVANIDFTLDGLGIRAYFSTVVGAAMVLRGKPAPDIYLLAAERLGINPPDCVVFEDAFSGIEAGLGAGMRVVALATTHTREELAGCGAMLVIEDFREII